MNFRPAREEDIPRLMAIAEALPEAPHWPQSVYTAAVGREATPKRIFLVAESSPAEVTGFVVAVLIPPQAELEAIAVEEGAQRQGIAGRLITELFMELKKRAISEVLLEVRESNHGARAFYAWAGFAETGRRTGYYSEGKEDAILLSRRVDSSIAGSARPEVE